MATNGLRSRDKARFEEWLDLGAGAFAAGFTMNSCDFTLTKAKFFWEQGWQGVEIDEAIRNWKDHVSVNRYEKSLAASAALSSELFHC